MEKNWDNCEASCRIGITHEGKHFVATRWDLEAIYCMESSAWKVLKQFVETGDKACASALAKSVCHEGFSGDGVVARQVDLGRACLCHEP